MKPRSRDNLYPGRNLNPGPPKYDASVNHSGTKFGCTERRRIRSKRTQWDAWLHLMAGKLLCATTGAMQHVLDYEDGMLETWQQEPNSAREWKIHAWVLLGHSYYQRTGKHLRWKCILSSSGLSDPFARQYLHKWKRHRYEETKGSFSVYQAGQVVMVMWNQIPGQEYKLPCGGGDSKVTKASRPVCLPASQQPFQ
jgi:hypothetical protein